ncbi:MAG TPA: glycosyltransferase family 2 protein [Ignavibacteriales bacterium]|nr:glycosyltransferase family 2 protein [Ignavibacteriales bacterium]
MENKLVKPDCSIIIVNYKDYKLIYDCIDSVIKHTSGLSYEIIVVDNSSEGSEIDRLKEKYLSCVQIIKNKENLGFARANNQGIGIARGRYILLLNNDTLFLENSLRKLIDFSESRGNNLIAGCKILNADMTRQVSVWEFDNFLNALSEILFIYKVFPRSRLLNRFYKNYVETTEPSEVDVVKGCFLFCPRDVAEKLNRLDERFYFYMEETDFCYRLKSMGGKVYYFPGTEIVHLDGSSTKSIQWFKFRNQTMAKIQFLQKHVKGVRFFLMAFLHYFGVFLRTFVYLAMGVLSLNKILLKKSFYYLRQLGVYPKNLFK